MNKRSLFDPQELDACLKTCTQKNDIVLRVKTENRVKLNKQEQKYKKCDIPTIEYVIKLLTTFNKDTRSYGINTGIEIAIDILEDIKYRSKNEKATR